MEEEIGESSDSPPTATTPSGKWTMISTYDIYMAGTLDPNNGGCGNDNRDNNGRNNNNNDDNASEPRSDLIPNDHNILNESLNNPNHEALRLRFIGTAKKLTSEKWRLCEDTQYLEHRWNELFQVEQELKAKIQCMMSNK